jgi:hypothetical protein
MIPAAMSAITVTPTEAPKIRTTVRTPSTDGGADDDLALNNDRGRDTAGCPGQDQVSAG